MLYLGWRVHRAPTRVLPDSVEIGMVAGSRPRGLGALVARFEHARRRIGLDETRVLAWRTTW